VVKAELDLFRAVLDRRADHGLAANLQRLSWCATQAREHLSLDHWHALKRLSAEIEACRDRASDVSALLEFLDEALTTFVSLSGFAMDTMTRDMGWRLHIVGRRLERLDNLAGTLARFLRRYTGLDSPLNRELAIEALLELCDSVITYRTRYRAQPELLPAIHLLTMDEANPHALAFQLRMAGNYLSRFEKSGSPWAWPSWSRPSPASRSSPGSASRRAPRRPTATPPASSSPPAWRPWPTPAGSSPTASRCASSATWAATARPPSPPETLPSAPPATMSQSVAYIVIHETEYPHCGVPVSLAQHLLHLIPARCRTNCAHRPASPSPPTSAASPTARTPSATRSPGCPSTPPRRPAGARREPRHGGAPRPAGPRRFAALGERARSLHVPARTPQPRTPRRRALPLRLAPRPADAALADFARQAFNPGLPLLAGARALMDLIFKTFTFDAEATEVSTPVHDVLKRKRGVCQDFAHLMIAALRSIGLPARYMSGYLLTDPPPGKPRLVGADASHAWVAVWCPGHGWIEYDPTNGIQPDLRHVTLGWGRDFQDVSPLRG
jgi:hypothetical protein